MPLKIEKSPLISINRTKPQIKMPTNARDTPITN